MSLVMADGAPKLEKVSRSPALDPDRCASPALLVTGEAEKLRLSNAALEMILPSRMGAHFQVMVQKKN